MASNPISVRLDENVRKTLERDAAHHRVGLATYLRNLATARARSLKKREIREETRKAAAALEADPELMEFVEGWTTPRGWSTLE